MSETNKFNNDLFDQVVSEIDALIVSENVKQFVKNYATVLKLGVLREEAGLPVPQSSVRFAFLGDAGTGKTCVARIVAKLLHAAGKLEEPAIFEACRSDLVAGYVGQTAYKTLQVLEESKNKLLVIDDFFQLMPENAKFDFGIEAVDAIINTLKHYPEDHPVVITGRADLVEKVLKSNPMLDTLFHDRVVFENLDAATLTKLFESLCKKMKYSLTPDALEKVKAVLEMKARDPKSFGNARSARNLFESAVTNLTKRLFDAGADLSNIEKISVITAEDIPE
jgi:hypothetical protein